MTPPPSVKNLRHGMWLPVNGVNKWIPFSTGPNGYERVELTLTAEQQKEAHRRYWWGDRDEETMAGEREYQTARKRAQRDAKRRAAA